MAGVGDVVEGVVGAVQRHISRGNQADLLFGVSDLGWTGFDVAQIHGREAISSPFEYDMVLVRTREQGAVEVDSLVAEPASLAIAARGRWRLVHGIVADLAFVDATESLLLYRLLLVPHLWRARLRRRCRNFVDEPLRTVLETALENRSHDNSDGSGGLLPLQGEPVPAPPVPDFTHFEPPKGFYRWTLRDEARLDDPELRSYLVQYNESDLDFVSRLLEEEGISYFFEHTATECVLTLSDQPGEQPLFPQAQRYELRPGWERSGAAGSAEVIRSLGERAALRPSSVTMRDFSWPRSRTLLEARRELSEPALSHADHFEFPARDEAVGSDPCEFPAAVRHERFEAAQRLAPGVGTVRSMQPGFRFRLRDPLGDREDQEYLVVSVEMRATQLELPELLQGSAAFALEPRSAETGCSCRFEVLPAGVRYRPAMITPKPRIDGVQTAIVTAEEADSQPEINCDEHGRVRVRFPWDQTPPDGTPSSGWIRVSQGWAGGGFGGLWHPRVGHEVLVAYLQGDPDRPTVVGRVYNVQTPPPYRGDERPTVSTLKSLTSPGGGGANELRFEDQAGEEEIFVHAQKDLVVMVENEHRRSVGADEAIQVSGSQSTSVDRGQSTTVGGSRSVAVGSGQSTQVGAAHSLQVGESQSIAVGDSRSVVVQNSVSVTTANGDWSVEATTGNGSVRAPAGTITLHAGQADLSLAGQRLVLDSGAGAKLELEGDTITLEANKIFLKGGRLVQAKAANSAEIAANRVAFDGAVLTDVHGGVIQLNCAPVTTGLGAGVDDLTNQSPTLAQQIAELQADGWKIVYGDPGRGSYCDRTRRTIVIDGNHRNNPAAALGALSHEVGHGDHQLEPAVPMEGRTRDEYVDQNVARNLRDEGAATLNNGQVREELQRTTGEDIGIAGSQSDAYQDIYENRRDGNISEREAQDQIGALVGEHEQTSTTHENYTEYYSRPYEQTWDRAHGGASP